MKNCTGRNCIMQYGTVDPATCCAVSYCPYATPPVTNADRIRAMTDEELADFLDKVNPRLWKRETWIKWLKQEA